MSEIPFEIQQQFDRLSQEIQSQANQIQELIETIKSIETRDEAQSKELLDLRAANVALQHDREVLAHNDSVRAKTIEAQAVTIEFKNQALREMWKFGKGLGVLACGSIFVSVLINFVPGDNTRVAQGGWIATSVLAALVVLDRKDLVDRLLDSGLSLLPGNHTLYDKSTLQNRQPIERDSDNF